MWLLESGLRMVPSENKFQFFSVCLHMYHMQNLFNGWMLQKKFKTFLQASFIRVATTKKCKYRQTLEVYYRQLCPQ